MIEQAHGNLLRAGVDALVNTVNTVGVMGKGIALQFKRAFPTMCRDYAQAAKRQELALGTRHVWSTGQLSGPRFVINYSTKGHRKAGSRLADIERGLDDLVSVIRREGIQLLAGFSRHVLATIQGHDVRGFGHGSAPVQEVEPVRLLPGAEQEAAHALAHRPETATHLSRVLELIEGFETSYGLELLATGHWVAQRAADGDDDAVVAAVRAWSPRKGRMFTPEHIAVALDALRSKGWTAALAGAH